MIEAEVNGVVCESRRMRDKIIAQAIAEGRYEPDDDPREINPHASRKPRPKPRKRPRNIGPLSYKPDGSDLPDDLDCDPYSTTDSDTATAEARQIATEDGTGDD